MYRVLIADDHPIVRWAVKTLLTRDGHKVIAEAGNGADAIQMALELRPDLLILDIGMPRLDGVKVITRLRNDLPSLKIVMLTSQKPDLYSQRCMHAGAAGYVYKSEELDDLLSAVRAVMRGYNYFPSVSADSVRKSDIEATEADRVASLTDRELAVLQQLAQGLSNKTIGETMMLSSKTISTHKTNILAKLRVRSVVELADLAKRNALITTP
ncbi:response regulator transcription factor [Pseudomonas hamedanensis]|uniref:Response regulator transcription factor n=1 Tax=Pseudomonas hamedanensis TaxID=2745504 RepID=A0A9E6P4M4_9PSED|nr:response regulator transcription factor [Pseudomonas hamedanensis]QXI19959.1 response regulator transcription factor [Pseudomonas hamedanensis]